MIFLTYWFMAFAPLFFVAYWTIRRCVARRWVLLLGCVVFHAHFAGPAGVVPIIGLGILVYTSALTQNRSVCAWAIAVCASSLVLYKYAVFATGQVVALISPEGARWLHGEVTSRLPGAPPLAISFFTFEFVHYLYDVRHGGAPIRHPRDFALFAIFWPSIVAGPIKRYQQFLPALDAGVRAVDEWQVASGLIRVAGGMCKKLVADNVTLYLDYSQSRFDVMTVPGRWAFVGGLSARILLDFSGYSDMAIGFARMSGITLPENFNWPYIARSIPEFWQRWHMSLSLWIRDYVYVPLGGNRLGAGRRVVNALIAMGACGLWHGADWNFLAWGLYHGAGLAVSHILGVPRLVTRIGPMSLRWATSFIAWIITLLFVAVGWVLFFYPLERAMHMIRLLLPEVAR